MLVLAELSDREGCSRPTAGAWPRWVDPALVAAAGAAALAVPALAGGRVRAGDLVRAVAVPFLAFVAGLAVVVRATALVWPQQTPAVGSIPPPPPHPPRP